MSRNWGAGSNVGDHVSGVIQCWSKKLRYVDMDGSSGGVARETLIASNWTDVFSYSGSGLLAGFLLSLESINKDWYYRLVIDGEDIWIGSSGMYANDADNHQIYGLSRVFSDMSGVFHGISIKTSPLYFTAPLNMPICYAQSVVVKVKRADGQASKKFRAGLVVLSKES